MHPAASVSSTAYCSLRGTNRIFEPMKSIMITSRQMAALFCASLAFACSSAQPQPSVQPQVPTPPPRSGGDVVVDAGAWVNETLARMSLRQKVGQLVVPRISGAYMPTESAEYERLRDWVVKYGVGGLIITQGPPLEMAAKLN